MSAAEAVEQYVSDGAVVGMGGQSIGRNSMALAHEIIRQGKKDLTLVGCNLALSMDMLVGAGLVIRTECGSGNLERFGTAFRWRRAIEEGRIQVRDYSHLGMASRFLAASLGLPFMPSKSMLGTDNLNKKSFDGERPYEVIDNPWSRGDPVVLLPALAPDVSIVHAQKADELGNVVVEGFTTQEPEMMKASKAVVVSCEELVDTDEIRRDPDRTTVPYLYVDAVVEQPWGGYPTSVYKCYEVDADHLSKYQAVARKGGDDYEAYLDEFVRDCSDFDEHLEKAAGIAKLNQLRSLMGTLV